MQDLRPIYFAEARARLTGNRLAIYDLLLGHGESTAKELARACGWDVTSVRPRLTELRQICHVVETGERRHGEHVFRALSPADAKLALQADPPLVPRTPKPNPHDEPAQKPDLSTPNSDLPPTPAQVRHAATVLGRYAHSHRDTIPTPKQQQLTLLDA